MRMLSSAVHSAMMHGKLQALQKRLHVPSPIHGLEMPAMLPCEEMLSQPKLPVHPGAL